MASDVAYATSPDASGGLVIESTATKPNTSGWAPLTTNSAANVIASITLLLQTTGEQIDRLGARGH